MQFSGDKCMYLIEFYDKKNITVELVQNMTSKLFKFKI